jgi:hypothetical protein
MRSLSLRSEPTVQELSAYRRLYIETPRPAGETDQDRSPDHTDGETDRQTDRQTDRPGSQARATTTQRARRTAGRQTDTQGQDLVSTECVGTDNPTLYI